MRLWSTVTSQLAKRPRCQAGICAVSVLSATELTLRQVVGQRLHLPFLPVLADRRHLIQPVADELLERGRIGEELVAGDTGADVSLAGEPVALRADAAIGL